MLLLYTHEHTSNKIIAETLAYKSVLLPPTSYIYICTYIYMHIYMHTYTCIYMCIYISIYMYVHIFSDLICFLFLLFGTKTLFWLSSLRVKKFFTILYNFSQHFRFCISTGTEIKGFLLNNRRLSSLISHNPIRRKAAAAKGISPFLRTIPSDGWISKVFGKLWYRRLIQPIYVRCVYFRKKY